MKTLAAAMSATIVLINAPDSRAAVLADLQVDYSNVAQGINGIQYGVYLSPNSVAGTFSTAGWVPVNGSASGGPGYTLTNYWYGGDTFNTPTQDAASMHPAVSTLDPAVRRYTVGSGSEPAFSGVVHILGYFYDLNPGGATSGFITVNGTNLFNMPVPDVGPSGPPVSFDISVSVALGSTIDFGVNAGADAYSDLTGIRAVISTVPGVAPTAVSIATASPSQAAYIDNNYSSANTGQTLTFQSLDVIPGVTATLGPNDTLSLTNGPLTIAAGAVFTGNGIINGNVINHGLLRIPIVRLSTISNIYGGYTLISPPAPGPAPAISIPQPVTVQQNTLIGIEGGTTGDGGGGTFNSGNPVVIQAPVSNGGSLRIAPPPGTAGYDASLEINGAFNQTATGKLRLFVGGDQKGVTYSHLGVRDRITLDGTVQLVLQPDLQGFLPKIGETFDLLESLDGIDISGSFSLASFVTHDGAPYLPAVTLSPYNSGIENDPDQLDQIQASVFTYELVDSGKVFRATFVGVVPEPSTVNLGLTGLLAAALHRKRRVTKARRPSQRFRSITAIAPPRSHRPNATPLLSLKSSGAA